MPTGIRVELLFAVPRTELFTRLNALIAGSVSFSAVVGFLTEEGISLIGDALASRPAVLSTLVVGATTMKACDGLDRLRLIGVPPDRLRVHLGHSRSTKTGFVKYHPMMHSKAYLFEGADRSTAIIGSHNLTGFAIGGQNTEASVVVEAAKGDPLIQQVRDHIAAVQGESPVYDPAMRLAYAWWFRELFDGMRHKVLYRGGEEDIEPHRNVVAIGVASDDRVPQIGDVLYLEVPRPFGVLKALDQPMHLYLLPELPASVAVALGALPSCRIAFRGKVVGTHMGVVNDGDADWIIRDLRNPVLETTAGRVFPAPPSDHVGAFIEITDILKARYEYVFETHKRWRPIYDQSESGTVLAARELHRNFEQLQLIPAEHLPWYRVVGLEPDFQHGGDESAIREASPDSGRYLLFSRGRRFLGVAGESADPAPEPSPTTGIGFVPADVWFAAASWAKDYQALKPWQRRLAYSLGQLAARKGHASEKQTIQGRKLLLEAVRLGFSHDQLTERLVDMLRSGGAGN